MFIVCVCVFVYVCPTQPKLVLQKPPHVVLHSLCAPPENRCFYARSNIDPSFPLLEHSHRQELWACGTRLHNGDDKHLNFTQWRASGAFLRATPLPPQFGGRIWPILLNRSAELLGF